MNVRPAWWRSIRLRATVGAVVTVGAALAVGAAALLVTLRSSQVHRVREPAELRAADIADALDTGTPVSGLRLDEGEDRFAQLVRDGAVVASSESVAGVAPLDGADPMGALAVAGVADGDDDWVLVKARGDDGTTVIVGRELDGALESLAPAATALAVGFPVLLAIVGATTWVVVGRALAPVDAIRAEVDEIGDGALDRRVPDPGTGDEIDRLAGTMNAMLGRLEQARTRQRRFVADASHELRSPVTAIRQHAEVARAHPTRTSVPELAEAVLVEDLRLQRLVDDLLVLTRSDDVATSSGAELDLDDLLLAAAHRIRTTAAVQVDTTGIAAARARGDERGVARVVDNLVDNAVRHAASTVRLVSREVDGQAEIAVHDDGPGIPPADRSRVLERFVRLDDARSRDAGGVGLGLAIVDEVVRAHGGSVTVSDSPLGGAAVVVRLPRASTPSS